MKTNLGLHVAVTSHSSAVRCLMVTVFSFQGYGFKPKYDGEDLSYTVKNLRRSTKYKFKVNFKSPLRDIFLVFIVLLKLKVSNTSIVYFFQTILLVLNVK